MSCQCGLCVCQSFSCQKVAKTVENEAAKKIKFKSTTTHSLIFLLVMTSCGKWRWRVCVCNLPEVSNYSNCRVVCGVEKRQLSISSLVSLIYAENQETCIIMWDFLSDKMPTLTSPIFQISNETFF